MLGSAERRQLLYEWNVGSHAAPAGTLSELFTAQVARTPDAVAVTWRDTAVSYEQLDAAAAGLARLLVQQGAGPERLVAVVLDRSVGLVTTLLAVLRAGAAYLPVDPGYPAERVASMLADAKPAVIVVTAANARPNSPRLPPRCLSCQSKSWRANRVMRA